MFELPLFPLNTVLFPGMPIQLHIFEERYKEMVDYCLNSGQPFGVVLNRNGKEANNHLAEPHYIGCSARILDVERLEEGKMNLVALGQQRFRIISLNYEKPYLTGMVESFPLDQSDQQSLEAAGMRLVPWINRYMRLLNQVANVNLDPKQLPEDWLVLAYLAAVLLQVPSVEKQQLLATECAIDMLADMNLIYRREVALLKSMITAGAPQENSFISLN
ncbi:MAG: LON peptidase substrate-binding domain-containing protein [Anaerolineales bacterium]|nr:LON peptidase substrate-binding domain-containing protein [Anaerolineales bacterium]